LAHHRRPSSFLLHSMLIGGSLPPFPPPPFFQQYTLLFTVANGAFAQQTFEAYATYVLPQLHNILAHSNPRPFAGNLEGYENWTDEDVITGELLCPNPSYPTTKTLHNKNNCTLPNTSRRVRQPSAILTPPLALVFHLTHNTLTPWSMQYTLTPLPLPPPPQTNPAQDRKARSKASKETRHRRKRRRAPLTPPSYALLSCALPNCTFIATTMAG
jgi:hypothetical protein